MLLKELVLTICFHNKNIKSDTSLDNYEMPMATKQIHNILEIFLSSTYFLPVQGIKFIDNYAANK